MKYILAILSVSLLLSCSKWTETRNIDMLPPGLEEENPDQYEAYLASLREYRNSDHKVMIVTVEGTPEHPSDQSQHLKTMADSVDMIAVKDMSRLHPVIADEIPAVHRKGTEVLACIDYSDIYAGWLLLNEDVAEGDLDPEYFANYCRYRMEKELRAAGMLETDGVMFSFTGKKISEMDKAGQGAFFSVMKEWRSNNGDKTLLFRGYAHNVIDMSIFKDCRYIIIPAGSRSTDFDLSMAIQGLLFYDEIPKDRFVIDVVIPDISMPEQIGATPQVAAHWVTAEEEGFVKSGISVSNAQDDYFDPDMIYRNIRESIKIMNNYPKE